MKWIAVLAVLLSGCGTGVHGLVNGMWAQVPPYRLNSAAACEAPQEAIQIADLGAVLYARAIVEKGWATYAQVALAVSQLAVCILPKPEKCCAGSDVTCVRDTDGQVREKAGCSVGLWSWASRVWGGAARDLAPDLIHEMGHSLAEQLGFATDPKHSTEWHTVIEPLVLKRFNSTRAP